MGEDMSWKVLGMVLGMVACGSPELATVGEEGVAAPAPAAEAAPERVEVQSTGGMPGVLVGNPGEGPSMKAGPIGVAGALDASIVLAQVRRHSNVLSYCHKRELSDSPDLAGTVAVRFDLGSDGVPSGVTHDTSIDNAALGPCLARQVAKMRFPAVEGREVVAVEIPLEFAPGA